MQGVACASCKHFHMENEDSETCAAFPDGIPRVIKSGHDAHREPFEGDSGIQWEPAPGMVFMAGED